MAKKYLITAVALVSLVATTLVGLPAASVYGEAPVTGGYQCFDPLGGLGNDEWV